MICRLILEIWNMQVHIFWFFIAVQPTTISQLAVTWLRRLESAVKWSSVTVGTLSAPLPTSTPLLMVEESTSRTPMEGVSLSLQPCHREEPLPLALGALETKPQHWVGDTAHLSKLKWLKQHTNFSLPGPLVFRKKNIIILIRGLPVPNTIHNF